MHLLIRLALILFVLNTSEGFAQHDDIAELRLAIIEFGEAYRAGDVDTVERLLAEQYVHINNGGNPINRQGYLDWNYLRKSKLDAGDWRVDAYALSDLEITLFGGSAVATGVVTASGQRDREQWNSKVRFSNFWIGEQGDWKRAGFHDTSLQD